MSATSETRVCIKNLPLHTFEQDLKEFLIESSNTKLEITDCKVLKNAKGKSRKVAFVGFRDASQAKMIVEKFDKAFMRMSRLSVQPALTKPEKKVEKTAADAVEKKATDKKDTSKTKPKTTKSEKKGSKFWGNDEGDEHQVVQEREEVESSPKLDDSNRVVSEGESSDSSDDSSSSSSDSSDSEDDMSVDAAVNKAKESAPVLSDMDFLKSKQSVAAELNEDDDMSSSSSDSDSDDDSSSDSDSEEEEAEAADKAKNSQEEPVPVEKKNTHEEMETQVEAEQEETDDENDQKEETSQSRLFVRNLPFGTTEEELAEYFSSFGKVIECHVPMDSQMKNNKGFAFVGFTSVSEAFQARTELDKKDFQGRLLHILQARPAPSAPKHDDPNLTWKQRQELARKERETKGSEAAKGWSASFVRGDAVVDSLADKLGLRKGEILGVKDKLSSGDAAVRLALGETQIIEENRQYFKEHGVDMDALVSADSKDTKRSKTSILVKNLPYDTRVEELSKLFQIGESTITVLLPPSRSIALVKYGHSADAKRAFKKLAYRRFKHVPIYLEWAPLAAASETSTSSTAAEPAVAAPQNEEQTENLEEDTNAEGTVSSTVYVKNLNFQTTEEILRDVFEKQVDGVRFVRIPKKTAPAKKGQSEPQSMSMGFGFVELSSQSAAEKAIKKLNGKMVDGHAWELSISSSRGKKTTTTTSKTPKTGGKNPTKLIVRNVPFQATRTELLKLFGSFGQLRKVRLPKKFDGSHRGFAFVDFVTSKEAQEAMSSLSRTHLYGRHLVLEWASNDEDQQDLDKLREKAKRDTSSIPAKPQNKRIKFSD
mmetsp:Transcript_25054/g.61723  ORF Transcript_25054/g.61723 Transcript_25054/m.61723 type:complete len:824 (-) Transcript_25054:1384-3855(-)